MIVEWHESFQKAYKQRIRSDVKLVRRVKERLETFQNNPQNPLLRDHALTGIRHGQRAFSITGDIRIVYFPVNDTHVLLLDIGTHNQVY